MNTTIRDAMARALYVSAWGDWADEVGINTSGCELMDIAPDTPPAAIRAADRLYKAIEDLNFGGIMDLDSLCELIQADPDDLGHYLAMEALGTGVAYSDNIHWKHYRDPMVNHCLSLPYMESHCFGDDPEADPEFDYCL